jgi:hypothetical protein
MAGGIDEIVHVNRGVRQTKRFLKMERLPDDILLANFKLRGPHDRFDRGDDLGFPKPVVALQNPGKLTPCKGVTQEYGSSAPAHRKAAQK